MGHSELLFYGGTVLTAGALLLVFPALALYRVKRKRLEKTLDEEYGPETRPGKRVSPR